MLFHWLILTLHIARLACSTLVDRQPKAEFEKLNTSLTPSLSPHSEVTELALDFSEQVFIDDEEFSSRAPASPTTVPNVRPYRPPSTGMLALYSLVRLHAWYLGFSEMM